MSIEPKGRFHVAIDEVYICTILAHSYVCTPDLTSGLQLRTLNCFWLVQINTKARKRRWAVGPKNALSYFKVYDFDCQTSPQFSCFSIPFIFMHQTFSLLVRLIGDKKSLSMRQTPAVNK